MKIQQDLVRLEAETAISKRECESLRLEADRAREGERNARLELQETLKSGAGNANSEFMA